MVDATEKLERLCTHVADLSEAKIIAWQSATVSVKTNHRIVHCNFTSISWVKTELFDEHFHLDEYSTETMTKYHSALSYHFGRGLFHRQQCPCDLSSRLESSERLSCSCYRFPCDTVTSTGSIMMLTNCTGSAFNNSQEDIIHVDKYQFKPPVGHLLE